ncbi:DUF427 domain-containing protein [Polyangium sp. rjm3]|uniref:DUF427 domain-containing protein n=1 Tax=Polyangium mundeleinium TaxID=2995306 RepID=A0ABT5EWZ8_9BACT|nr:DUF427 domain-containing protein [Polyangium mundeleinium]MDC0745316.1 DUF427 domain-containing protein [Polyangium mundeleinium]
MRILFLGANGIDTSRLQIGAEFRDVQVEIERARASREIEVHVELAVTPVDLNRLLLDYEPDVVHFSGHGTLVRVGRPLRSGGAREFEPPDEGSTMQSALLLETRGGLSAPVSTEALARLFGLLRTQRCVVLNACFSSAEASALAAHVDCLIGMRRAIDDESALVFAVGFYQAIARGQTVKAAFDLGCSLISTCGLPGADVPQLRGRVDPDTVRLVDPQVSTATAHPLQVSDLQVIPNPAQETSTLDFRVYNSGNEKVLINRVTLRVLECRERPGSKGYLEFSREYDLDITSLEKAGDVISCNVAQLVGPRDVDRFGIRLSVDLPLHSIRFWRLRPMLSTNHGPLEGPEVKVWLPPTSEALCRRLEEQWEARMIHWRNATPGCLAQYRNAIDDRHVDLAPLMEVLERAYPDMSIRHQVLSEWLGPQFSGGYYDHDILPVRLHYASLVSRHVRVEPLKQPLRISVGRIEIVNTTRALVLQEAGGPPRYYVPRKDVQAELKDSREGQACILKGRLHYIDVTVGRTTVREGASAYPGYKPVRDHVAFFPEKMASFEIGGG